MALKIFSFLLGICICDFDLIQINYNDMKYNFNFYTQYHQFYITSDDGKFLDPDSDEDPGYENKLIPVKNSLTVFTESYGRIKGEIDILDSINKDNDLSPYDHVVEASLEVESGVLQILDCPNSAVQLEIKIKPGKYKVRVYMLNIEKYDEDKENDYYKIEIWADENMESKVLKKFIDIH